MKKQDKELLIKVFDQYLIDKNMTIKYSIASLISLIKNDLNEKISEQKKTEYLFEKKISEMKNVENTYEFINFLLEKKETREMGFRFMVEKMTSKMDNGDYEKNYLNILEKYPEHLLKYISRPSHLLYFFKEMDTYFVKYVKKQEERELIIDLLIGMPLFKEINNERIVYNLTQKYIDNTEKYIDSFPNIKPFQNEDDNLEMKMTIQQAISFQLKSNILINYCSELEVEKANRIIKDISKNMKMIYEEIGVADIVVREIKHSFRAPNENQPMNFEIIWRGINLEKELILSITNIYLKNISKKLVESKTWNTNVDLEFMKEVVTKARAETLTKTLSTMEKSDNIKKSKL